jgi:hypothetical protein
MVCVEFLSVSSDSPEGQIVATVVADGVQAPRVDGVRPSAVDLDSRILSVSTGKRIGWRDDAEEWARSLPASYRGPYLMAQVTHDDDPPAARDSGRHERLVIRRRVRA